jgi:hypothetical protein
MSFLPELSVKYKTYLKTAVQEGLASAAHPDEGLKTREDTYEGKPVTRGTKVTLEWPKTRDRYPCVVVKFYERNVQRMGVGHEEWITLQTDDLAPTRMFHNIYDGDLEFAIYGLSNYDRDLMSDTIVQTMTMGWLEGWTNHFMNRLYKNQYDYASLADADITTVPDHHWNYVSLNHDTISGFGETQAPVPWDAEDEQLYICQYRVAVLGEFYSVPPTDLTNEFVANVPFFPYIEDIEDVPEGDPDDPASWEE